MNEAAEIDSESRRLEQARSRCPKAEALLAEVSERNGDHRLDMLELALGEFVQAGREVTAEEEKHVWQVLRCEPFVAMPELRETEDGRAMRKMPHSAATEPQEREPMNVNDAFPSKTLKASDLQGNSVSLVISRVEVEKVGSGNDAEVKPIVYFAGKQKGLVLNKTNSKRITEIVGTPETDNWKGHTIILFPTETEFQGETVDCIRVKKPQQAARPVRPVPTPPPPPPPPPDDDFVASDDDVPF